MRRTTLTVLLALIALGLTFVAVGAGGGSGASSQRITASLTLPASPPLQEGDLTLAGEGFAPGEIVVLAASPDVSGLTTEIGRVAADHQGHLTVEGLTLPDWLTSGPHTLEAIGQDSLRKGQATLYVRAKDFWVQVDKPDPHPLEKVGMIAGGFEPGDHVRIHLRDAMEQDQLLAESDADPAGNMAWTEVEVPVLPAGEYKLVMQGEKTEKAAEYTIHLQPFPTNVELTSYYGPPGATTSLTGQGFAPNETVRIYLEGYGDPVSTIVADQWGNFYWDGGFEIPYDLPEGKVTVTAVGDVSQTPKTLDYAVLGIKPWGGFSDYAGAPGTVISFNGGGFAGGEDLQVSMTTGCASAPVLQFPSDGNGNFYNTELVQIPMSAAGKIVFIFQGQRSGGQTSATFEVIRNYLAPPVNLDTGCYGHWE